MGAKFSKGGKVKQNGTDATHDESLDTFNKTSTLPASFRKKDDEVTKTGTLPRGGVDLDRNKSFSKRFRKSITKLVGQNEVTEETSESQVPTEPSSVVLGQDECKEKLKDVAEEEVDSKVETPLKEHKELDLKSAQKAARAQFFQDLYNSKEQAHIPKPPRNRNIPSPVGQVEQDADITVPATLGTFGTPVVKLIKKHEGEIEKQQELIGTNTSVNFPENENKDSDSPQKVADVYSGQMIKDDFVCASEKQVEEFKQEDVSAVKEETTLREENISVTKSMSSAASNAISFTEEKSTTVIEEKMSSVEMVEETKKEEISVVKEESYSREETIMKNETSTISAFSDMKTEEAAVKLEENMSIVTNAVQVEEIKQEGVLVKTEETTLTEETILKEETLVTESMNLTDKKDIQIETDEDDNTSFETEDSKSDAKVKNTKEQSETLDAEKLEIDAGMELNESDITEVKEPQVNVESQINSSENERIEDPRIVDEPEQKDGEESEMTKDNGALALHDSEHKAITSQEKEEKMIDPNNAQQDIRDDNFTEPNSLEGINQNDEINQSVAENKDAESTVTGESDLVKGTVILDNDVKGPFDVRSEGGSEGGVSTDEGIVASDDEENKSELHKVDNLEAKVHKSAEKLNDDAEPEKEL